MPRLSIEAKEALVLKALNRGKEESIVSIAQRHNVTPSRLYEWLQRYREGVPLSKQTKRLSASKEPERSIKFQHLVATSGLDDVSLGTYCREHGLYTHRLTQWRENFMSEDSSPKAPKMQSELKSLKDENKRLQRELRRKDKALAEASALLIMKKKADLIWGDDEDD